MSDDQKQILLEAVFRYHEQHPDHQTKMTEAARLVNTGKERSEETRKRISESNLNSEARKAFAESRRGVPRTDEEKQTMSEAQRASEKVAAYHQGRIGKSRGNNPYGYGIIWDKARSKFQVRIQGKNYGRFGTLEEAVAYRDETVLPASSYPNLAKQ